MLLEMLALFIWLDLNDLKNKLSSPPSSYAGPGPLRKGTIVRWKGDLYRIETIYPEGNARLEYLPDRGYFRFAAISSLEVMPYGK